MCDYVFRLGHKPLRNILCVASSSQVAIKSIRKERITDDLDRIHIQREIEITSSLRHPNVIRFHEGKMAPRPLRA